MDPKMTEIIDDVKSALATSCAAKNIANSERVVSLATGSFVLYKGITGFLDAPFSSLIATIVGGALIWRGATGYCPVKDKLNIRDQEVTVVEHRIVES